MAVFEFEPCAQCGQRSYVFVEMSDRRELSFCGHHFSVNEVKLTAMGVDILDLRYLIAGEV